MKAVDRDAGVGNDGWRVGDWSWVRFYPGWWELFSWVSHGCFWCHQLGQYLGQHQSTAIMQYILWYSLTNPFRKKWWLLQLPINCQNLAKLHLFIWFRQRHSVSKTFLHATDHGSVIFWIRLTIQRKYPNYRVVFTTENILDFLTKALLESRCGVESG